MTTADTYTTMVTAVDGSGLGTELEGSAYTTSSPNIKSSITTSSPTAISPTTTLSIPSTTTHQTTTTPGPTAASTQLPIPSTITHQTTTTPGPTAASTQLPTTATAPRISVSITSSGTNTAGEAYSLVCSVTVTGSNGPPTITWLDPVNNAVSSEMVSTTDSVSTLTFNPLSASHTGTYTCIAAVGGEVQTDMKEVTVQSELLIVMLIDSHVDHAWESAQNPFVCKCMDKLNVM